MTIRLVTRMAAAAALAAAVGGCALTSSATMSEVPLFPPAGKPPTVTDKPLPPLDLNGLAPDEQVAATIYHQYTRGVVNVTAFVTQQKLLGGQRVSEGTGSGSIMDQKGNVLTNLHVVRGAAALFVTLYDGSTYPAKVIGADFENDLAVIRFEPAGRKLTTIKTGSGRVVVGQRVYALGNPFGLEHTLTTGIVSAIGRPMSTEEGVMMKDLIQTDAAINPGNSGGPLLNASGEMIGINTMIVSPSGGSVGIGFAVPISTALRVVPDLLEHGRVMRGWIDIIPVPIFPMIERLGGLPVSRGIIVSQVKPGSAAASCGPPGRHPRRLARLLPAHDLRRRRHHPGDRRHRGHDPRRVPERPRAEQARRHGDRHRPAGLPEGESEGQARRAADTCGVGAPGRR